MFTAHDAGHRGITQNFIVDTLIGMLVADFCCGLSIGWWKSSHNVHHLITNHPVRIEVAHKKLMRLKQDRNMIQIYRIPLCLQLAQSSSNH